MATTAIQINDLILEQLGRREMRLLTLVVAVRKSLGDFACIKGDLSATVQLALRKLIAAKVVVDAEGVYGLAAVNQASSTTI